MSAWKWAFSVPVILLYPLLFLSCNGEDKDNDNSPTVTDIDGNVYTKLQLGTQVWLKENLKVTHFNNGDEIANITNNNGWKNTGAGAFCYFDNNAGNGLVYGKLYNFTSVYRGGLCPVGYHVPTMDEWTTLLDFLGGDDEAGGKMKQTGTALWHDPNQATNESGFTALPGGYRTNGGTFDGLGSTGLWWSSTLGTSGNAQAISLHHSEAGVTFESLGYNSGVSVRCIKD